MLKNENIICISSIDWDFVWQGHQEIMSTFARNGNKVLFIENTGVRAPGIRDIPRIKKRIANWLRGVKGIREERKNLYIFSPLILPFPYSRLARWINKYLLVPVLNRWMKVMNFNNPVIWTFLPTGLALDLINNIDKKFTVYYCIADFEKLVKNPHKVQRTEKSVIQKSDLIFAQGEKIKQRCKEYNPNVSVFPFGVNLKSFMNYDSLMEEPEDIANVNGILLGYIGGIHRHIDFGLIRFLAERNPNWTLVFIGPSQTDIEPIANLKNIVFLDMKEHKELSSYINKFKVCLIPYALNEYTKTVYPTKLNEYFAMGKPVVSTPLPEMESFSRKYYQILYIGKNSEEFENHIKKAIGENDPALREKRIKIARENSWERRIEQMSSLIEKGIEAKRADNVTRWKDNLLVFYKAVRKKVIKLAAICLFAYLILFKSPLAWFIASPLRISDVPQKADAIVVFGGGVGETGSPGKSTIERARYATQLYNDGYANKIIFSSGYTYIYNDAENMKLIADSMGVKTGDIILEQESGSTYENVVFTKEILDKMGWRSVLLVSSPYNMRRASLVFKKVGPNIDVNYAPVKNAQFFDRQSGVKPRHIRAFMHEYLGIVYYFFKGYI